MIAKKKELANVLFLDLDGGYRYSFYKYSLTVHLYFMHFSVIFIITEALFKPPFILSSENPGNYLSQFTTNKAQKLV